MTTQQQIDSFHQFARSQISDGTSPLSLDEMVEQWRMQQRAPALVAADVAAIREALVDMRAGECGQPADDAVRQLRAEFGIASEE